VPAADRALLERILREGAVDTRIDPPAWQEWLRDVLVTFLERVANAFGRRLPALPPGVAAALGWTIVALLVAAVALIVVRSVSGRAASRRAAAAPSLTPVAPQLPVPNVDWRSEAARRLAAGQAQAALEAAWWWFATAISGGPVDPAWTTREVLLRARRADLMPLGQRLDVWMYGGRRPGVADVALLLETIEAAAA
jgi:hypothetical protein